MKVRSLLLFFIAITCQALAQHPLIGTWEMISIKGINAAGEKFANDSSTVKEIKIITPTHYMLIAYDVEGDSLAFNRCYAGTIHTDGNKYNEIPLLSSVPIFENVKTDYTWKVNGDTFTQAGTFTRPDGKKIVLEELLFKRVKTSQSYPENPINGAWKLLSSTYTTANGVTHSDTNESVSCLQLITPTHWMYVSSRDKKFEHAMGGDYIMKGGKFYPQLNYASFPKNLWGKTEMSAKVEGNTMRIEGISVFPDGRKFSWNDLFERLK
jgi:hypothetical protein